MIDVNRQGDVWVFAEQEDHALNDVSLELCGKAQELAGELGVRMAAVLPVAGAGGLPAELIAHGADTVYVVDNPRLAHYRPRPTPGC